MTKTSIQAINEYFLLSGVSEHLTYTRPTIQEMKALTREERHELGALCAEQLGVTITETVDKPA